MGLHAANSTESVSSSPLSSPKKRISKCAYEEPKREVTCLSSNVEHLCVVGNERITSDASQNTVDRKYIASLDIGTTVVRCLIFNKKLELKTQTEDRIELLSPKPGRVEIDPEEIWLKSKSVLQTVLNRVGPKSIICLGICTQRGSFLIWDSRTGKPLGNIITWKDTRSSCLVNEWNHSALMRTVRWCSKLLYFFTRNPRFLASSVLTFMNVQVILRLKWVLENSSEIQKYQLDGNFKHLRFGTLDTWILHRLTGGQVFATEYSNASATAMFDPFLLCWSGFVLGLVGIPMSWLPPIKTSAGQWGCCDSKLFGAAIPITAVVSDQGASLAGCGGYEKGHVKLTLGTGGFLNMNTGLTPHASVKGIYPVIGWQEPDGRVSFMAEGSANDVGTIVEWGRSVGLYDDVQGTAELASSVADSGAVYFVPAFHGLQAPVNDSRAACGFIGIKSDTTRAHLVRALLDSIAFLVYQIMEAMLEETSCELLQTSADGGVASNTLVLQQVATLSGHDITRYTSTELSARGAALLAAVGADLISSVKEGADGLVVDRVFVPRKEEQPALLKQYHCWQAAIKRFTNWNDS